MTQQHLDTEKQHATQRKILTDTEVIQISQTMPLDKLNCIKRFYTSRPHHFEHGNLALGFINVSSLDYIPRN
jgi:hypothetical protein